MRWGMFHRWMLAGSLSALLYGGAAAFASEADTAVASPAPRVDAPAAIPLDTAPATPHIALLLPVDSAAFARHAEAVKSGFLAAAKTQDRPELPIRLYAVGDDVQQVVGAYRQALGSGARLIVGPLTRSAVAAIAASNLIAVPTLALNVPDPAVSLPPNLYSLSLHVENEARQVARFAYREGRHRVLTVTGDTPLLRRIHQAFIEEFRRLGGEHVAAYEFTADPAALARIRQSAPFQAADMVFFALDFPRARIARPYFDPLPLYATSQVHPGNTGPLASFDLANVRFLDMPWLLQPDHPAVMIYPRPEFPDAADLQRLYALGIDAFRAARALLEARDDIRIDGVTGRLVLGRDRQFIRELTAARYADGKLVILAEGQ
jgi:outer membrane PBP1 activator LpoA protein